MQTDAFDWLKFELCEYLGLYIVENIIKAHKLTLSYEYKNGLNVFSFENLQNIAA